MLILMLTTHRGSEDGFVVRCFRQGAAYDMEETLARLFIARGYAVEPHYGPPQMVGRN